MLLDGHVSLLKEAISSRAGLKKFFSSQKDVNLSYDQLEKGVKYPDVPCAKRQLKYIGGKPGSYDLHVAMQTYDTCNPMSLIKYLTKRTGFAKDVLSEAYLSHNYLLAYLHSMTPNPNITNGQVLTSILQFCRIMASLAIRDVVHMERNDLPNAFWLGILIHTITDSFSPAHTLRYMHYPPQKIDVIRRVLKNLDRLSLHDGYKPSDLSEDVSLSIILEIANDVLLSKGPKITNEADVLVAFRSKLVKMGLPVEMYPTDSVMQKRIIHMFKTIYMYQKLGRDIRSNDNMRAPTRDTSKADMANMGIVSFMYYNSQDHSAHIRKDTLMYIKGRYGSQRYLQKIVEICADILDRYVASCKEISTITDKAKHKVIQEAFVKGTMETLRSRVFFMHDSESLQLKSGANISRIKKEFLENAGIM